MTMMATFRFQKARDEVLKGMSIDMARIRFRLPASAVNRLRKMVGLMPSRGKWEREKKAVEKVVPADAGEKMVTAVKVKKVNRQTVARKVEGYSPIRLRGAHLQRYLEIKARKDYLYGAK